MASGDAVGGDEQDFAQRGFGACWVGVLAQPRAQGDLGGVQGVEVEVTQAQDGAQGGVLLQEGAVAAHAQQWLSHHFENAAPPLS